MKKCTKCKKEKELTEFYTSGKYYKSSCKECFKTAVAKYNKKDIRKEYWKQYYQKNKDKYVTYAQTDGYKKYQKSEKRRLGRNRYRHSEKGKIAYRKYKKEKKKNNLNYKIECLVRSRINASLKNKKKHTSIKLLGCSIDFLKKYLQEKFTTGMTWENHGLFGWHIDHIIPISSFDLTKEEQLLQAFNYKNLQPLWAMDNLKKGAKIL